MHSEDQTSLVGGRQIKSSEARTVRAKHIYHLNHCQELWAVLAAKHHIHTEEAREGNWLYGRIVRDRLLFC